MTGGWDWFVYAAAAASLLWAGGSAAAAVSDRYRRTAVVLMSGGILVLGAFIVMLWTVLGRPPMKTMGETRLWYSLFLGVAGLLTYLRWGYRWILSFSSLVAIVFCIINIAKPEIHDSTLMPALQSVWFIPHVTVYMFSYSVLGCAFLLACAGLLHHKEGYLESADRLVYTGTALLTIGMMTGAIWAKAAWGDYWNWDPKETWAAVTWCGYLIYIHLRLFRKTSPKTLYIVLVCSFLALQMCWYGVNWLPAAQQSVHLYNRTQVR